MNMQHARNNPEEYIRSPEVRTFSLAQQRFIDEIERKCAQAGCEDEHKCQDL